MIYSFNPFSLYNTSRSISHSLTLILPPARFKHLQGNTQTILPESRCLKVLKSIHCKNIPLPRSTLKKASSNIGQFLLLLSHYFCHQIRVFIFQSKSRIEAGLKKCLLQRIRTDQTSIVTMLLWVIGSRAQGYINEGLTNHYNSFQFKSHPHTFLISMFFTL